MAESTAFFAYPSSPPALAETVREGARKITATGTVKATVWEDLKVAGTLIIDTVLQAIDDSAVSCFELTALNHNVLFEFGYAIGRRKRVWPLFDNADSEGRRRWQRLRLLTTVGYAPYVNSDDIRAAYLRDVPHLQEEPLFDRSIQPALQPKTRAGVFYVQSNVTTDASRVLTRRLERERYYRERVITADPSESSVYPLTWYAQQAYNADLTVVHLAARKVTDSEVHNARASLVAGLARGMDRPILILAERDYLAPIDYQDLSYVYDTSKDLLSHIDHWLDRHRPEAAPPESKPRATSLELTTELKSIHFGEPVAENEADELGGYFLETASYAEVLRRRTTVFVGRKGSGKSANFLQAAEELRSDARNLVCVVQPSGYELQAVVRFLTHLQVADEKSYAIESLWQYLLLTEIARAAAASIRNRPVPPSPGTAEDDLLGYVEDASRGLAEEFAVRLERVVQGASTIASFASIEERRGAIASALHGGELQTLRRLLGEVLKDKERVCVLIDNLDKAWDRASDLSQLSHLLLGLLAAIGRVDVSFRRSDSWRRPVDVTLAVFLRSDIFEKILASASEPDKVPVSRILWTDRALLLRVVEERYRSTHEDAPSSELWEKYFVPEVGGVPIEDYILWRVLPRPRDLVQFCSFALTAAINAGHSRIEEADIRRAERLYSQFAFEALLVENGLTIEEIEAVLLEFAGGEAIMSREWVEDAVNRAGLPEEIHQRVIGRLRQLSFLGVEIKPDEFSYEEDARDEAKFEALARNLAELRGWPSRYQVHPAYRPYLEMVESF